MRYDIRKQTQWIMDHPPALAYFGLTITMITWALVPVFLKKLLTVLTPIELSFSRFMATGLILLGWVALKNRPGLAALLRRDFKLLAVCTVLEPDPPAPLQRGHQHVLDPDHFRRRRRTASRRAALLGQGGGDRHCPGRALLGQ